MRGEYSLARSQLKGYLFEIIIKELLLKNNFSEIDVSTEPRDRVREYREDFIEVKGRGCWHQIDCPCDYNRLIPFSYPIRLLGEVKFYKTKLEKKHIREYVGVIKDIQENYFVSDNMNIQDFYPRKMEIGVYFSANGFQQEAEKLAYAHGIKTVSYVNNLLINRIKKLIEELEENCLSVKCMNTHAWGHFRREIRNTIRYGIPARHYDNDHSRYYTRGYRPLLIEIHQALFEIRSSFIATTSTGVFLHFVGKHTFPEELFRYSDEGLCRVFYEYDNHENRFFWLEITGDDLERRFYFTPPEALDEAAIYGGQEVLSQKERDFRVLNVNIMLNGIMRNLTLHLDRDWLDAARK